MQNKKKWTLRKLFQHLLHLNFFMFIIIIFMFIIIIT